MDSTSPYTTIKRLQAIIALLSGILIGVMMVATLQARQQNRRILHTLDTIEKACKEAGTTPCFQVARKP